MCESERWTVVVVLCWTNNRFWEFKKKEEAEANRKNKQNRQTTNNNERCLCDDMISELYWFRYLHINKHTKKKCRQIGPMNYLLAFQFMVNLLYINRCWCRVPYMRTQFHRRRYFLTTKVTNLWDNDTHIYFKSIHSFVFRSTDRLNAAHTTWYIVVFKIKSNQIVTCQALTWYWWNFIFVTRCT